MAGYNKIPEVAYKIGVSEKTARRYVKSGELPASFIGGAYRVSDADLEKFLEGARFKPGKAGALLPSS
jgi:excisionase family DNA binding protein